MKKRFEILFAVLFISMLVVGAVNAFTMGGVDGQWSRIEPVDETNYGSATNNKWATGPVSGSTDYDNPTTVWNSYTAQSDYSANNNPPANDWNQVRYGNPYQVADIFGNQSGFGFDGVDDINEDGGTLIEGEDFLLGKWCHFNNPIIASDYIEYVDLQVRIEGITCPGGGTIDNDILEVAYRFTLDETTNSLDPCPYPPDIPDPNNDPINAAGCADGVFLGVTPLETSFICTYSDNTSAKYTVTILGSVPLGDPTDDCPDTPGTLAFEYYSAEGQDNCSCLYATISEWTPTAVALNAFSAAFSDAGVEIAWETASEVDNLGFNLYRSSSPIGMKVKLNESMIPSKAIGSTSGANYRYLDEDLLMAGKIFYWLESIDLSGRSELYGPVEVFSFK